MVLGAAEKNAQKYRIITPVVTGVFVGEFEGEFVKRCTYNWQ